MDNMCIFCKKKSSEVKRTFWVRMGRNKVKACRFCRAKYFGNPARGKRFMLLGGKKFRVLHDFGLGKVINYDGSLMYVSFRKRSRHLYMKDNSYPISSSIVEKLKEKGVGKVGIAETFMGARKLYVFSLFDYLNGNLIRHKGYDSQYSVPLEKALYVIDLKSKIV